MYIKPKYQTILRRVFAQIIDGIIFLVIANISDFFIPKSSGKLFLVSSLLLTLLGALYFLIGYAKFGFTIGKKMMGLRVMNLGETGNLSYGMAFMRLSIWLFLEAAPIVLSLADQQAMKIKLLELPLNEFFEWAATFWLLMNFITVLFNEKRRAIHDYIAGSVVVKISLHENQKNLTREPGDLLDPVPE